MAMRFHVCISRFFAIAFCAALLAPVLLYSSPASAAILRVSLGAPGPAHDGATWPTAYTSVQAAINTASGGDEIWVAQAVYSERITLKANVALYGGFVGTETARDARSWTAHPTVLDGGAGGTVVTVPANAPSGTALDGFTVRNGTGTLSPYNPRGGGIYCGNFASPTIRNNVITANTALDGGANLYGRGGGMFCEDQGAPLIANNVFSSNRANGSGALDVQRSDAQIIGNVFQDNIAEGPGAGAAGVFTSYYSHAVILGNTFTHNVAMGDGGALSIYQNSQPLVAYNTFVGNESQIGTGAAIKTYISGISGSPARIISNFFYNNAAYGAAVELYGNVEVINNTIVGTRPLSNGTGAAISHYTSRTVANNILAFNNNGFVIPSGSGFPGNYRNNDVFGNTNNDYYRVSGPWNPTGSNGNISADPGFVNMAGGDLHITGASPCRDAGDTALVPTDTTNDVDGQPRVGGAQVDIGADELHPVLAFSQQPGGALAGQPLSIQPIVRAQDTAGNAMTAFNGPVSVALKAGTGTAGALLNGTKTVNAVNGFATFTDLSVTRGGAGYVLTASTTGLAGIDSATFTITLSGVFVHPDGSDASEGASWKAPKRSVVDALAVAGLDSEVWVAGGIYEGAVRLPNMVRLYGGFSGREEVLEQRNPLKYETVLVAKGSVVTISATGSRTVLDGFTIRGGTGKLVKALPASYLAGGGVFMLDSSAIVANNTIIGNSAVIGGGIYVDGGKPRIERNAILENMAQANTLVPGGGGGIALNASEALLRSNVITRNIARGTTTGGLLSRAGGVGIVGSSANLRNNTVIANEAEDTTAIDIVNSSLQFINNIVAFNTGGVRIDKAGELVISHNDVYRNREFGWAGIEDPAGQDGNISEDPRFVDLDQGNYHLRVDSICRDAGYTDAVDPQERDRDGGARIVGPDVDMGAYELATVPYSLQDAILASRISAGLSAAGAVDVARLDVESGASAGRIDGSDTVRLIRKATGLDP